MDKRRYKIAAAGPGRKDTTIMEITDGPDGKPHSEEFLVLLPGTPPETKADVLDALRCAYQTGRKDRSAELPEATGMAREVQHYAIDVLQEWAEGYEIFKDGTQRRIDVEQNGEDAVIFKVRPDRYARPERRYRIRLAIEELEVPAP